MSLQGLALASRYSNPPNFLHLCGPEKQKDLTWYAENATADEGTMEILSQFSTMYPYLSFIAYENNIQDPFDEKVIEAYWLGNYLLKKIKIIPFVNHISDTLQVVKKIPQKESSRLLQKVVSGALPHHSFHVLNIWRRTGHDDSIHTIQTMDACLINWGQVIKVKNGNILVKTRPLTLSGYNLIFGKSILRILSPQGSKDVIVKNIKIGDWLSYHWGKVCQVLTPGKLANLKYFTSLSILYANSGL